MLVDQPPRQRRAAAPSSVAPEREARLDARHARQSAGHRLLQRLIDVAAPQDVDGTRLGRRTEIVLGFEFVAGREHHPRRRQRGQFPVDLSIDQPACQEKLFVGIALDNRAHHDYRNVGGNRLAGRRGVALVADSRNLPIVWLRPCA